MSTDWKDFAPCREAESPKLFDVPPRDDRPGWDQLRATAERFCQPCPFITQCAADPNGAFGLWAGTARWERQSKPQWEALFVGAPEPTFDKGRDATFGPFAGIRKRGAA